MAGNLDTSLVMYNGEPGVLYVPGPCSPYEKCFVVYNDPNVNNGEPQYDCDLTLVQPLLKDPGVEAANLTGLFDVATGQPVYSLIDDDGEVIHLYYHDPITGEKIVTNTGFTTQTTESAHSEVAYETLANGAVEKLNKYVTIVDGVPQPPVYTQFGSGTAYTPADVTRVEPKPIKMLLGSEVTFPVGNTVVAFPAIPTVTNAEGENFPQYAYVHVNADGDGIGAGISYTTDGSNPASSDTAVEFEVSAGQGFELDTYEEIVGFRVVAINKKGDPDGANATSVDLSVEFSNVAPSKDDV